MTRAPRFFTALARRAVASAQQQAASAPALCFAALQQPMAQLTERFVAPALARSISTSSFAASGLQSVLAKELKHEKQAYEKPDIIAKGPPAPFTLEETPGDTAVTLKREYKGEQIAVDASVNLQENLGAAGLDEGEEEEEEEFESNDVNFNVTVTKGDQSLVFECISDGTYVDIRHVSLEPKDGDLPETFYTGPVFQELDEDLQQLLRSYLEERGVNEDLGEYLRFLMYDKEQVEYMRWLENMQKFMSS